MPRSRMIKPEFWDDEKLASISRDARLTFIGMWTHSDDYGVVKGNPTWLKNKIYPYEEIRLSDFQKWLTELENLLCILPFETEGEKYFYIRTFIKHQTINRPSQQRNPEPPSNLLEDSLTTHGALTDETETETENTLVRSPASDPETDIIIGAENNGCPHQKIISLYHEILTGLPQVRVWTPKRQKMLKARWLSSKEYQDLEWWRQFFEFVRDECPHLTGKNDRQWTADLEWLCTESNFVKTVEGRYHKK